ncbi:hypothetical protein M0804_001452 [Polistes exclamans]|nr:hypothetical protein M0804_001452 [Polistes exclamans]
MVSKSRESAEKQKKNDEAKKIQINKLNGYNIQLSIIEKEVLSLGGIHYYSGRFTGRGRRRTRHSGCREASPSPNKRLQERQNNNNNEDDDDDDDNEEDAAAAAVEAEVVVGQMSKWIRLDAFTRVQRSSLGKESPV